MVMVRVLKTDSNISVTSNILTFFTIELLGKNMKPQPSDDIPKYLRDGVKKQDLQDLYKLKEYIVEVIEYRNIDTVTNVADDEEIMDVQDSKKGSVVLKKIPCGKECSGCPHGPYKYRVYRKDGDVKWDYIGKPED